MIFFFHDSATPVIYTLSLHDALPISENRFDQGRFAGAVGPEQPDKAAACDAQVDIGQNDVSTIPGAEMFEGNQRLLVHFDPFRSEEHTSELQSHSDLVCRLLLEEKNI